MKATNKTKGIAMIISAAFFFAGMGVFVRLAGDVPSIQKSFFRNAVASVFAFFVLLRSDEKFKTKKENIKFLVLRSVCGTVGILGNFYAIDHMALSDASMLNKLSPFFATFFSFLILKERVSFAQGAAIVAAFLGSLLVIKPGLDIGSFFPGLVGFLGGMGAGMAYTFVRLLTSRGERKAFIVFFFSLFSCAVTLPWVIFDYHPMSGYQLAMLICAGFCACGGQFSITNAYSYAPAKEISVFDYTQVIFSAIFGFFLFDQRADLLSVLGYVVIIGAAVFTAVRQRRQS
ncbi:MAG: DMT family transporter [Clostridia bacterium]|nr:DMT family transporter [Clostridia bacterium]